MLKHSIKREAIYDCISSTISHPTAEWIYTQLKSEISDLSLATVYRNLAIFKEKGMIISVANVNGQERFDANTSDHAHFICNGCGDVIDINAGYDMQTQLASIKENYGVNINSCKLLFYGCCEKCCKKNKN